MYNKSFSFSIKVLFCLMTKASAQPCHLVVHLPAPYTSVRTFCSQTK